MNDRDYRNGHPPYCTCVKCSDLRISDRNKNNNKQTLKPYIFFYWDIIFTNFYIYSSFLSSSHISSGIFLLRLEILSSTSEVELIPGTTEKT